MWPRGRSAAIFHQLIALTALQAGGAATGRVRAQAANRPLDQPRRSLHPAEKHCTDDQRHAYPHDEPGQLPIEPVGLARRSCGIDR